MTTVLKKIAANPTNSAAINQSGLLYVWGTTKYGLCRNTDNKGKPIDHGLKKDKKLKVQSIYTPQLLPIFQQINEGEKPAHSVTSSSTMIEDVFGLLNCKISNSVTQYFCTHIDLGTYHGGVICNDVDTNYEFKKLLQSQRDILDEYKKYLLGKWEKLDRNKNKALQEADEAQDDFNRIHPAFNQLKAKMRQIAQQELLDEPNQGNAMVNSILKSIKRKATTDIKTKTQHLDGQTSEQLQIEYELRAQYFYKHQDTFPFVRYIEVMKQIEDRSSKAQRFPKALQELMDHFAHCAEEQMKDPGFEACFKHPRSQIKRRDLFAQKGGGDNKWVNLKELRDQMLGQRCSNGMLFMFGVKNEANLSANNSGGAEEVELAIANVEQVLFPDDGEESALSLKLNFPIKVAKIACGSSFSIALTTGGHLYSWGFGKSGSLGLGRRSESYYPSRIEHTYDTNHRCVDMVDISCGSSHSLAVDQEGSIFSWGNGQGGRLGHGSEVGENQPRKIEAFQGKPVRLIEAGDASSACITHDSNLYMWGSGLNGRLGNGTKHNLLLPEMSQELKKKQVQSITMGTNTTFAMIDDGKVLAWGSSKNGKLGFELPQGKNYELPREVVRLAGHTIYQIAAGPFHTLCLTTKGKILAMGNSKDGKLGIKPEDHSVQDVELPTFITHQERGDESEITFFQFESQEQETQLRTFKLFGDYDENYKLKPIVNQKETKLQPFEVLQVSCGSNFELFLTNGGEVFSCGANKYGQLGTEKDSDGEEDAAEVKNMRESKDELDATFTDDQAMRRRIEHLNKQKDRVTVAVLTRLSEQKIKVVQIATGAMHAMAVTDQGAVYGWGNNSHGQLGMGKADVHKFSPTRIQALGAENQCKQVACGENHTVFLMVSKLVWACGSNEFGQLGLKRLQLEELEDMNSGMQVDNVEPKPQLIEKDQLDNVDFVAAGRYHTVAIRQKTEGDKDDKEQEDENEEQKEGKGKEDKDASLSKAHSASAGQGADKQGGKEKFFDIEHEVYTWGRGYQGQLGHKQVKNVQWTPLKVRIKNDARLQDEDQPTRYHMATCGEKHTLLLTVKGAVWYTGEKSAVGIEEDYLRAHAPGQQDEDELRNGYQPEFVPYFNPNALTGDLKEDYKMKFISSNFVSPINYAISKKNCLYHFGYDRPFQALAAQGDAVDTPLFIDSSKTFSTLIDKRRVPYTWGEFRNGMLGKAEDEESTAEGNASSSNIPDLSASKSKYRRNNFYCYLCFRLLEMPKAVKYCGHKYCRQCIEAVERAYREDPQNRARIRKYAIQNKLKPGEDALTPQDYRQICPKCRENLIELPVEIEFFRTARDERFAKLQKEGILGKDKKRRILAKYDGVAISHSHVTGQVEPHQGGNEPKYPVQKRLKSENQAQFEHDLIQRDTDLLLNFKEMVKAIHAAQAEQSRELRSTLLHAQDSITSRIEAFPIPNVDKLEDLKVQIPQVVILNKQIYEIMFTILQTHPCYLINWIKHAITKKIDLFDDHPQAFLDKTFLSKEGNQYIKNTLMQQDSYLNHAELAIKHDEFCQLILAVFGGFKMIRNDRRCVNQIMMIAAKIWEFEVSETAKAKSEIYDYNLYDILTNSIECIYVRLHRLVFHCQQKNMAFIETLFEKIVIKLYCKTSTKNQMTDGLTNINAEGKTDGKQKAKVDLLDAFDFEKELKKRDAAGRRAKNLQEFMNEVLTDILCPALESQKKDIKSADSKMFSYEVLILSLYSDRVLKNVLKARFPDTEFDEPLKDLGSAPNNDEEGKNAEARRRATLQAHEPRDQLNQLLIRVLFDDLFTRLQTCKAHDIIFILSKHFKDGDSGLQRYEKSNIIQVNEQRKGNNLAMLGIGLRNLLSEGKLHFTNPELTGLKNYIEWEGIKVRQELSDLIRGQLADLQVERFDNILIQQTIEQALELENCVTTVQLRDIIYLHNQLCRYGQKHIFIDGFKHGLGEVRPEADEDALDPEHNPNSDGGDESVDGHSAKGDQHANSQAREMDPLQIIFHAFNYQEIIVRVYETELIDQKTLSKSLNLQIQTRIFETFNEVTKCHSCNALVYPGLLPHARIQEGVHFKSWVCKNRQKKKGRECGYNNLNHYSMICKKCGFARGRDQLPRDILFQPFLPAVDDQDEFVTIANVRLMEQVLITLPLIKDKGDTQGQPHNIVTVAKEMKKKENERKERKDFELINLLENFNQMKLNFENILKQQAGAGAKGGDAKELEARRDKIFDDLCSKIHVNIEHREAHRRALDENAKMIKEIQERKMHVEIAHKKLINSIGKIRQGAPKGIGNPEIQNLTSYDPKGARGQEKEQLLLAGKLEVLDKKRQTKEAAQKKKNPEADKLANYFNNMQAKQELTMTNQRLQRKLDDNRKRRELMKAQFGQFQSFSAAKLIEAEVIKDIQVKNTKIIEIQNKCQYLFYEVREDDGQEGGYKIELSFEEKQQLKCDFSLIKNTFLGPDQTTFGSNNQSILQTFFISNEQLLEMRRLMTTKCSVDMNGTTFNIFKLVKMINQMKAKNQRAINV